MEYDSHRRLSRRVYDDRERYSRRYERPRFRSIERSYRRHERSRSKERRYRYAYRRHYEVRSNYVRPSSRELRSRERMNHKRRLSSETGERTYRDRSVHLQRKSSGTERRYREMEINKEHIKARYVYSQDDRRYEVNYEEYRRKSNTDRNTRDDSSSSSNSYHRDSHEMQVFERQTIAKINNEERRFYGKFVENSRPTDREDDLRNMQLELMNSMEENRKWNNRHWSEKEFFEMNERDWRMFREDYDIKVTGDNIPPPVRSWNECKLRRDILQAIQNAGYNAPTPIQMQAIPIGLESRDIVGVAETASGKTFAYMIPLLNWIKELPIEQRMAETKRGPNALILVPNRELARQITSEINRFAVHLGIRTVLVVGGMGHDRYNLAEQLRICDIIVATPANLAHKLKNQSVDLSQCTYVVLDEVDQIFTIRLGSDVEIVFDYLPVSNMQTNSITNYHHIYNRRTVMFAANMTGKLTNMIKEYLQDPIIVHAGTSGPPIKRIEQTVIVIKQCDKFTRLRHYLSEFKPPIIIFVNQKIDADLLATDLQRCQYNACSIHSEKCLAVRNYIMDNFRTGYTDILVTTNIIGSGIGIPNVTLVINYDMACTIEDYMHRIGRTGRVGKHGVAVTFCTNDDSRIFNQLRHVVMSSPIHHWIQEIST